MNCVATLLNCFTTPLNCTILYSIESNSETVADIELSLLFQRTFRISCEYENAHSGSAPTWCRLKVTGAEERVRQTRRRPDQCLDWDKPAYRLYRSMPAQTSRSGRNRELGRCEYKHILSALATHSRFDYDNTNKILTGLRASLVLETADGHLSPCV